MFSGGALGAHVREREREDCANVEQVAAMENSLSPDVAEILSLAAY